MKILPIFLECNSTNIWNSSFSFWKSNEKNFKYRGSRLNLQIFKLFLQELLIELFINRKLTSYKYGNENSTGLTLKGNFRLGSLYWWNTSFTTYNSRSESKRSWQVLRRSFPHSLFPRPISSTLLCRRPGPREVLGQVEGYGSDVLDSRVSMTVYPGRGCGGIVDVSRSVCRLWKCSRLGSIFDLLLPTHLREGVTLI